LFLRGEIEVRNGFMKVVFKPKTIIRRVVSGWTLRTKGTAQAEAQMDKVGCVFWELWIIEVIITMF
jgi:hypothetical protein